MYASYFGLKQAPFSIAPDPRYLFMSERHREALAHLLYGVNAGGGFVLLTGEIGAGKTTVCRCFLEQIPRRCNVAYIFNPKLSATELMQSICDEFRIPVPHAEGQPPSLKAHVDALNEYLLKTHAVGQNNVLIIDEAQNLSPEVLEQLRLLTNLETSERKLLQIILIGQPELRQMLARPELEQMAQRVIARFHLDALTEAETAQYIQHRLETAGLRRGALFDRRAVQRIHARARGVPRRINLLCDRALLGAYVEGKSKVDRRIVDKAAAEVFEGQADIEAAPAVAHGGEPTDPAGSRRASGRQAEPWPRWVWALFGSGVAVSLASVALTAWMRPGADPTQSLRLAQAASHPMGAASAGVSATKAPTTSPPPPMADALQVMRGAAKDEVLAWQDLAGQWQAELGAGDACNQLRRQDLLCFRNSGGLSLLTQLDRPALLTLQDGNGATRYAVLTRLDAREAWLQMGDSKVRVTLPVLSSLWRGDFATVWRTPDGYRAKVLLGQTGPVVDWLAERLSMLDKQVAPTPPARFDAALQARLQAFQLSQGLKPDGVAGATTFMLINRATGVNEPRLSAATPAPAAPSSL